MLTDSPYRVRQSLAQLRASWQVSKSRPKWQLNWTYSKQSTQAVKADAMPIAPATMPNGSVIVERNDYARDTLEVDRESRWEVFTRNFSCSLITLGKCNPIATGE
jgi:hypothetical protein